MTYRGIDAFQQRHIGTSTAQQEEMANSAGFDSVAQLIDTAVPDNIKLPQALNLPDPLTEREAILKLRADKYWAPVNRVDNVFGDRNLICSCPSIETYLESA